MQFPTGLNWGLEDFAAAVVLLTATWAAIEIILRLVRSGRTRALAIGAAVLAVLAVWAQLAVGIV
jgi:hypothetical protein